MSARHLYYVLWGLRLLAGLLVDLYDLFIHRRES